MKAFNRHNSIILIIALMITMLFVACQEETETPAITDASIVVDSVTSVDSLMIYYDVRGIGDKALVFVHGWSCDRSYWDAQTDEFAKIYRVVTIDLGGHGQSGLERETWSMAAFGADVAAVVSALDLSNVTLVGHSMGGSVIIEAARLLPDRVVALVGVDNFHNFSQSFTEVQIKGFTAPFAADFANTTNVFVRSMFPEDADSALVEQVAKDMALARPEVAVSALGEFLGYDYRSALNEMRLPIRVIGSDHHPVDIVGNRAIIESFQFMLMPGRGHFLHLEDPTTFNQLLATTLAEFWPETNQP